MRKLDELIAKFCPNGVEWKSLEEVFDIKNGYTPSKAEPSFWKGGTLPWFRMEDIRDNGRVLSDSIQHITRKAVKGNLFPAYSIILATSATIGEHALLTVDALANQRFTFLTRKNKYIETLNMKYFFYYCFIIDEWCKNNTTLGNFLSVDMAKLKKLTFPIPPLPIQEEIVLILDNFTELTTKLTAKLITELTARKEQYEYYREYLITNSDCKVEKMGNIADIYLGLTYTPTYVERGVKFISAQNTSSDYLNLSNVKYISEDEYNKSTSNAKPKRGDILFTRVGSNLGHPVIVDTDEKICIFVSLGYLRIKDERVKNTYIKHWMNTDLFWAQVRKNVHGAAKVNLNTGWLKKFEVLIPSLKTQTQIVTILDRFENLYNDILEKLSAEIEARQKQYEYYRDKLLTFKECEK
ncbi:restriction endonuclease subunit S [Clostridium autoethanogenum]|uniref:Restriction endonuclease subunit S n=1 Tax=Clostridium autoethanogenum TaxID=84023 RepID=A0A3M0SVM0_9CLOT|nr:restriction endonuclease subunit S [Clostridium autoethanogenum]RMD02356.1 restriction endonuclease subunit S [Clostridium autoethanogenum]